MITKEKKLNVVNVFPVFTKILDQIVQNAEHADLKTLEFLTPSSNIYEMEDGYEIEVALPGIKKEEIEINTEKDYLVIKTNKSVEDIDQKFLKNEFLLKNFKRAFLLSNRIDKEKIGAKYENGVLYIHLKKIKAEVKNISIL